MHDPPLHPGAASESGAPGSQARAPAGAPTPPTGSAASEDVLAVLEEFEVGLDSLKKLYVQRQALVEELARRTAEMAASEAELQSRRDGLSAREREVMQSSATLGERWKQLDARERELQEQRQQLDHRTAAVEAGEIAAVQRQSRIDELSRAAEQQRAELTRLAAELDARTKACEAERASLTHRASELQAQGRNHSEARRQLDSDLASLETQRAELQRQRVQLAAERDDAQSQHAEIKSLRHAAESKHRELSAQREALESQLADLEARRTEHQSQQRALSDARRQFDEDRAALEAQRLELDRQRTRIAADRDEVRTQHADITSQRQAVESQRLEIAAQREALESQLVELESRRTEIDRDRSRADAIAQELQNHRIAAQRESASAQQLEAVCEDLRRQLDEAQAAVQSQADTLRLRAGEDGGAVDELQKRAARLQERLDEAVRTGEAGASRARELEQRIAEAESALEAAAAAVRSRELELEQCRDELAAARDHGSSVDEAQHAALADRLRTTCEAVVQLRQERDDLASRAERLDEELRKARLAAREQRPAKGGGEAHPVHIRRRRERLVLARDLSRKRSLKVKRAEDALATRFEQCERILAMRQELADAREAVTTAQRKADRQRASGRTAALAFYGTAVAAILGVLSWFGVLATVPGTYVAHAMIVADAKGRTLTEGDYVEWQSYHEKMLDDPRFVDVVAERMARRGIADLGKPGDFAAAAKKHLMHDSAKAGEITLEWRDQGAERTQRILDTIVTAMSSQSSAARERRVDGAITEIRQPATAGKQRLDTDYRLIAAGVWAGSMVLCFGLAALVWSRLAHAKATFEGSAAVDAAIDMRRWNLPVRK